MSRYIPSEIISVPDTTGYYYGIFVKKSYAISSNKNINFPTMLVKNIINQNNEFVRDHIWINNDIDNLTRGLHLKYGDVVRFVGCQIVYRKGFRNTNYNNGQIIASRGVTVKCIGNMVNLSTCRKKELLNENEFIPIDYIPLICKLRMKNNKYIPEKWKINN